MSVAVAVRRDGVFLTAGFVLNVSCDNVYGTAAAGDWQQNNISATSSVSVVANKACHITVLSYNDGSNTWTPVSSQLVVNISSSGVVTSASALQYQTGSPTTYQWYSAVQGSSSYTVIIGYVGNSVSNATTSLTSLTSQTITLSAALIAAPVVSSLTLYNIPSINSGSASNTLTASVSGYTACKLIDNTSGTYTPSSWSSVNTAYAAATTTCPSFVDGQAGFAIGNWTNYWVTGHKTLVMWANTVDGMNAYAVANIGP